MVDAPPAGTGRLAQNILYFARTLRAAGLPVGPGATLDAVRAVEAAGLGNREDFRATLHALFVKKHEHDLIFHQAFDIFWRKRGFLDKLLAMLSPVAEPQNPEKAKAPPGASRVSDAMFKRENQKLEKPQVELDYRLTMSAQEVLQRKDFAQMSAEEIAQAKAAISRMNLSRDELRTRRFTPDPRGPRVDPRRSFRQSLRAGGASIELAFRAPALRRPPIVAICDISGSMSDYTRVFLHFLHALGEERGRVHTFLFGTRLTNVTRSLRHKDPDEALAACAAHVEDWSGGTRIGATLHEFNRLWSRRVLGQGASVLLFTDGLERDGGEELGREMGRMHKSARRVIWLNPLLRYDRFEPRAQGIRAILPHVDEFRPVHNLASIADLVRALSGEAGAKSVDPRLWLRRAG
jgi:uncharacterized protein with von Willebrand factor type A (vWA) domain